MARFAAREDEVDDLFRPGAFTDLYRAVRHGVRAGVEERRAELAERLGQSYHCRSSRRSRVPPRTPRPPG